MELTRDARTIFVGQLVARVTEGEVAKYFEQVGAVEQVVLIKDKAGKCKGQGYVEFTDIESVPKSLLLNGQKFCMRHEACTCSGFPLLVKRSEAEKNYSAVAEAHGGTAMHANAERRVYVGNLPPSVTEGDMRQIAEAIGPVDKVAHVRDERKEPRGVIVITFGTADIANKACSALHKMELSGRVLKVGRINALGDVVCPDGESYPLDTSAGRALTAQARAAYVATLASQTTQAAQALGSTLLAATAAAATGSLPSAGAGGAGVALPLPALSVTAGGSGPTTCLLLKGVFDPAIMAASGQADWDIAIRDAIVAQMAHLGLTVVHAHVAKDAPGGLLYMMLSDVGAAIAAANALVGVSFGIGGHAVPVAVDFVPLPDYISRFPDVASKVL